MHFSRRNIIIIFVVMTSMIATGIIIGGRVSGSNQLYTLSGTIEATEIHLSTRNGGVVKQVYVEEGELVTAGEKLAWISNSSESITSPIKGVLLERLFEPGELTSPGSVVMVVANLQKLKLQVYAPEDRYGQFTLGQVYPISVDSFPDKSFYGKISHIAGIAEFTPRNVQTIEGRKSTVFAITLDIDDTADGNLIPGMPADVHISFN
jgi:multidrug resistance efflux pump